MSTTRTPHLSPSWDAYTAKTTSALRKARQRQDSLGAVNESRFPTIDSLSQVQAETPSPHSRLRSSCTPTYTTPNNNKDRWHSVSLDELEHQPSVEELERPATPTWKQSTKHSSKSGRKEEYQGWHMQFVPTHPPAVKFAYPHCYLKFDSRHYNEFPRPKGKRKRCDTCFAYLGYFRREVDLYGTGEAYDEGSGTED